MFLLHGGVFYSFLQLSELALEVAILYYGGHLVVTGQMSGGTLISFFIYMLELGECLEVRRHPWCSSFERPPPTLNQRHVRYRLAERCVGVHGPHAGSRGRREGFRVPGQEAQTAGGGHGGSGHVRRRGRVSGRHVRLPDAARRRYSQGSF